MTSPNSNIQFNESRVDDVFETLISLDIELKNKFDIYRLKDNKNEFSERLSYLDMAEISKHIVEKTKAGQTKFFQDFFNQVEIILSNCDSYVEDLIVVGLFEGIQNIGGKDINYYSGFNKWLQPISKQKWDNLIDSWEGQSWRNKNTT